MKLAKMQQLPNVFNNYYHIIDVKRRSIGYFSHKKQIVIAFFSIFCSNINKKDEYLHYSRKK